MAKSPNILGPNSSVKWNSTDLSTWCTNISLEDSTDEVETTGLGETYRDFAPGLKDANVTATFIQDYGSTGPDATLSASYYNNTAGTLKVNPDTSGTVIYTLVSKIFSYSPVTGGPGEANSVDVTFRNFGTAGLTRGTA